MNNDILLKKFQDYMLGEIENIKCSSTLKEAIKYSLISDGKYIRPRLFLEYILDSRYTVENYFSIAMCIEMVHTYSLIHDDLPCMDDDDYRRGKLSVHKKFGEDIAILTGDALLTNSFEKITNNQYINSDIKVKLICLLCESIGYNGMVDGQVIDIKNEISKKEDVDIMHIKKTGKLISFALESASLIVEDGNDKNCSMVGNKIGLFYQIQDDYFDKYSSLEKLGKAVGKDIQSDKKNYTYFYTKEELDNILHSFNKDIVRLSSSFGENIQELFLEIIKRDK